MKINDCIEALNTAKGLAVMLHIDPNVNAAQVLAEIIQNVTPDRGHIIVVAPPPGIALDAPTNNRMIHFQIGKS